ncbi:tRNAHis guanylyltransferase-domain-containing protein [Glomus cerebriforme]|uniref:tRNA(His) guanylyltransferase n=1 Tax=Glomus cerebriforme TaxID=658196 RepID=A0A397SEU5_9GLOM|nr:tRNAHis guanylyltransferase-domain-containing protein [Glomus cerebriforme]
MAKSKYEYVKQFERDYFLIPNTWLVIRIDGRGFHQFSDRHQFEKPNDRRALDLMNKCAEAVMIEIHDIILAYGQSDEFSFILKKECNLYGRREAKIISTIVSLFTSNYVFHWKKYFPDKELHYPPSFDGRAVQYPSDNNLRDYLSWRQADCHINNLYNTCFWALVHSGKTEAEAENTLRGTSSSDKNELLYSSFNINYNDLPEMYRKGSILIKQEVDFKALNQNEVEVIRKKNVVMITNVDIIRNKFWEEHPELKLSL